MAVTFHQGVSTAPPHLKAAGDCVCLVSGYFFIKCFLYCLLYIITLLVNGMLYFTTRTHTGVLCSHEGHEVKLDFRFTIF